MYLGLIDSIAQGVCRFLYSESNLRRLSCMKIGKLYEKNIAET
jgi:hypothetical protein